MDFFFKINLLPPTRFTRRGIMEIAEFGLKPNDSKDKTIPQYEEHFYCGPSKKTVFFTCGPNWTRVCSHIIGYIPVPVGLLFAIAPTHDWTGNGANLTCTWALKLFDKD